MLSYINYSSLRDNLKQEYLNRTRSDVSSFKQGISLDLMLGDTESVTTRMKTRLGSDLVAILVYDTQAECWPSRKRTDIEDEAT